MLELDSLWIAGGLCAAVIVLAAFVNGYAPQKRPELRRTVILLVLYLACFGVSAGLEATGFASAVAWAGALRKASDLFAVLTAIHMAGVVVFQLGLPSIGVRLPSIVVDVAVGGAYVVATMQRLGVDPSGILATSAVVTAVLALSLQTTLGNVIGGVALQLDDSIRPGEWIQLENGKQGQVREIRWRHTVIETRDWDTIIVPNAQLLSANIVILGKRAGQPVQHRMWVYFNVDFRHNPADVIRVVEGALQAGPMEGVATDPRPHCIAYDLAKDNRDSFVYYAVRYWLTDLAHDDPTSSRVRTRVFAALQRAGISLALPAAQIFVDQDDAERRHRKARRETERRAQAIAGVDILKPLREDERAHVAEKLLFAPFVEGEVITRQGAIAHWLYIVTRGEVRVCVTIDGVTNDIARITAPGFFGEMGLMTGAPRRATIVAASDVECYRLDKDAFHEIMAERPEIAREISELLAQRGVELDAAREQLDAAGKERRIDAEKVRILSTVQTFFGLSDERPVNSRPGAARRG